MELLQLCDAICLQSHSIACILTAFDVVTLEQWYIYLDIYMHANLRHSC